MNTTGVPAKTIDPDFEAEEGDVLNDQLEMLGTLITINQEEHTSDVPTVLTVLINGFWYHYKLDSRERAVTPGEHE